MRLWLYKQANVTRDFTTPATTRVESVSVLLHVLMKAGLAASSGVMRQHNSHRRGARQMKRERYRSM